MLRVFFLMIAIIGLSGRALAEVRQPIADLFSTSYRDGILTYSYGIGGGCVEHFTDVRVELSASDLNSADRYRYTAIVKVFDVTQTPDYCEAYLSREGSVDLRAIVRAEAARQGLTEILSNVSIILPPIYLQLNPFE